MPVINCHKKWFEITLYLLRCLIDKTLSGSSNRGMKQSTTTTFLGRLIVWWLFQRLNKLETPFWYLFIRRLIPEGCTEKIMCRSGFSTGCGYPSYYGWERAHLRRIPTKLGGKASVEHFARNGSSRWRDSNFPHSDPSMTASLLNPIMIDKYFRCQENHPSHTHVCQDKCRDAN